MERLIQLEIRGRAAAPSRLLSDACRAARGLNDSFLFALFLFSKLGADSPYVLGQKELASILLSDCRTQWLKWHQNNIFIPTHSRLFNSGIKAAGPTPRLTAPDPPQLRRAGSHHTTGRGLCGV